MKNVTSEGNTKTFLAGEAIAENLRVKINSTAKTAVLAGAGEDDDGVSVNGVAIGVFVTVKLRNSAGTFAVTLAAACSRDDLLYGAAGGKVTPVADGLPLYKALAAGTAANSVIEALKVSAGIDQDQAGIEGQGRVELVEDLSQFPGLSTDLTMLADTITDSSTGTPSTTIAAATNIDTLTDSSGGAADDTVSPLVAIADTSMVAINGSGMTTAQEAEYDTAVGEINTAIGIANDNFKELTDQAITQQALNIVLIDAVASLAAEYNELQVIQGTRAGRNLNIQVSGTNSTSALCTYDDQGGLLLTTAGADGDQMILEAQDETKQTLWEAIELGTEDEVTFECTIVTAAAIADMIAFAGLKLTSDPTTATDDDQVFFRFEDSVNTGILEIVSSRAGVDTETSTGVTIAASTKYNLKIVIFSDRTFKAYVNGALVHTGLALTNAIDLKFFIGVETDENAANAISVLSPIKISRDAAA